MENDNRMNLLGLDRLTLTNALLKIGEKKFRANQLIQSIHKQSINSIEKIENISLKFKQKLNEIVYLKFPKVESEYISYDKTIKWLFDVGSNNAVETVYIPEKNRGTLCISSQAGCLVNCSFCSTGKQGFNRNLSTYEIIGQLWFARKFLSDSTTNIIEDNEFSRSNRITNVVMMGMGEPLLNYNQLLPALLIMLDDFAYGLSRRKVTVSTSGIIPMINRLARECPVSLAVSLHAPTDELRDKLVPINKKYPIKDLLEACCMYISYAPRNFITFEYCMLKNVNDTPFHAKKLINLLKNISCKINIIPFNNFFNSRFECSDKESIDVFVDILSQAGFTTTLRKTRGDDINAACGQLAGNVKDKTKITFINSKNLFLK